MISLEQECFRIKLKTSNSMMMSVRVGMGNVEMLKRVMEGRAVQSLLLNWRTGQVMTQA